MNIDDASTAQALHCYPSGLLTFSLESGHVVLVQEPHVAEHGISEHVPFPQQMLQSLQQLCTCQVLLH